MCWSAVTSASSPTTASRRSSSTVVAGLVRSALARNPGGSRSASTLSPTASAVTGDTAVSTTWFRRSVSVQKGSSPNVQCRKMYWLCAGTVRGALASNGATRLAGAVGLGWSVQPTTIVAGETSESLASETPGVGGREG